MWRALLAAVRPRSSGRSLLRSRRSSRRVPDGSGTKLGAMLGVALGWTVLYAVASPLTLLWSGSNYSPGQGGGLEELIRWAVGFGVAAVIVVGLWGKGTEAGTLVRGAVAGHVVGTVAAIVWFTSKNGPVPGDWWVGPAGAATGVLLATLITRRR